MVGGIPEMMVKSLISIAADPANKNAVAAFKEVRDLLGQNTTLLDKEEQRARIASLRAKTDQLKGERDNGAIAKLDEVLKEIEGVI